MVGASGEEPLEWRRALLVITCEDTGLISSLGDWTGVSPCSGPAPGTVPNVITFRWRLLGL